MAIEYNIDDSEVKFNLVSPDETPHPLSVTDEGAVCVDGDPVAGNVAVFKSSDQSLASSTTMQDDDDLKFTLAAGVTWIFRILLFATEAGTNPNIKLMMAATDGLTGSIEYSYNLVGSTAAIVLSDFTTESNAIGLTADKKPIVIEGCVTAINAGTLTLQWAQASSDIDATIVHAKSSLRAFKVG